MTVATFGSGGPVAPVEPGDPGDRRGAEARTEVLTVDPFTPAAHARPLGLIAVRSVRSDDVEPVRGLFERLSPESRYRRFFSPMPVVDDRLLRWIVEVDHHDREAVVALVGGEVVGLASYDRSHDDPTVAEVAIMVEDDWQRAGIGRLLTRELGVLADRRGITRFTADVLNGNVAPVRLARAVSPALAVSFADGQTHLVIGLHRTRPA